MRKLLTVAVFCCLLAIPLSVKAEDMTITTYYPSPNGVYRTLTLHAHTGEGTPCSPEGKMYFDNGTGTLEKGLYICEGTPGTWKRMAKISDSRFGGMFQNGNWDENRNCGAYGPSNSTDNRQGMAMEIDGSKVINCCEAPNPYTIDATNPNGICGCPTGFHKVCMDKTDEPSALYADGVTARSRADETCYCLPD